MLSCPQCGAEYREGYSSCSDCHVLLVRERPQTVDQLAPTPGDPNEDPFCSFWKGTDARICAELCTVLDEAGIPHKTVHRQDHLFNIANRVPYELGVPASFYEKAERAVKDAFGTDDEESERLLHPTEENSLNFRQLLNRPPKEKWAGRPEDEQQSLIEYLTWRNLGRENNDDVGREAERVLSTGEWNPEDATAEAWDGNQSELREMIEMSLQENEIHSRWEEDDKKPKLFVRPQDETLAREIIHEILNSTPQE
jgi:hypothetical protein